VIKEDECVTPDQVKGKVLKDCDLKRHMHLHPKLKACLLLQLETDTTWLLSHDIMDYSLLMGIVFDEEKEEVPFDQNESISTTLRRKIEASSLDTPLTTPHSNGSRSTFDESQGRARRFSFLRFRNQGEEGDEKESRHTFLNPKTPTQRGKGGRRLSSLDAISSPMKFFYNPVGPKRGGEEEENGDMGRPDEEEEDRPKRNWGRLKLLSLARGSVVNKIQKQNLEIEEQREEDHLDSVRKWRRSGGRVMEVTKEEDDEEEEEHQESEDQMNGSTLSTIPPSFADSIKDDGICDINDLNLPIPPSPPPSEQLGSNIENRRPSLIERAVSKSAFY